MAIAQTSVYKRHMRGALYVLNFILAIQMSTTAYYIANFFTDTGIQEKYIGFIFVIASLISIVTLIFSKYLLARFGNYKLLLLSALINLLAFLGYAISSYTLFLVCMFILSTAIGSLMILSLDLFLSESTVSESVGKTRSFFLTSANIAFVVGPFIGGFIIQHYSFKILFLGAALLIIPFVFIAASSLKSFRDPHYPSVHTTKVMQKIWHNPDVFNVFVAQFLLRFFYAVMGIYTPLYLIQHIGFTFQETGIIFSIMLLPFVLFEIPVGKLADAYFGEKELMGLGFIITALSSLFLIHINETNLALFAAVLFITRTGASMIEITTESYFFKHVDQNEPNIISAFRALFPIAYIIAPLTMILVLAVLPIESVFIVLAIFVASGVFFALKITDTK